MYTRLHVRLSKYIFQQQQNNKIHKGNLLMKKEKNALTCLPSSGRTPPVRWFHFDPDKYKIKCLVIHTPVLTSNTIYISFPDISGFWWEYWQYSSSFYLKLFYLHIFYYHSSKFQGFPFYNLKIEEYFTVNPDRLHGLSAVC